MAVLYQRTWEPRTVVAMVWAKRILASHGVTTPPSEGLWQSCTRDTTRVLTSLRQHRLTALAAAALLSEEGPELPADITEQLQRESRRSVMGVLNQTATAARLQGGLAEEGIDALFFKGVFQACQSAGGFAARGSGDIDVLVATRDLALAVDCLTVRGAVRRGPEVPATLRYAHQQVTHAVDLTFGASAVDLHHRLDPDPHVMRAPFDDLMQRSVTTSPGGVKFRTLSPLDSCALIASHGARDNWASLRHVCDFALAVHVACPDGDLLPLMQRAEELGVRGRVELAVEVARVLVPELPQQGQTPRLMGRWAWSRHAQGRLTRGSDEPRDAMATFAFWILSERNISSFRFGVRRLVCLPSTMHEGQSWRSNWSAPLAAPISVARRIVDRKRYGMYGGEAWTKS